VKIPRSTTELRRQVNRKKENLFYFLPKNAVGANDDATPTSERIYVHLCMYIPRAMSAQVVTPRRQTSPRKSIKKQKTNFNDLTITPEKS